MEPEAGGGGRVKLALFASCWLVLTLHFATNISREHYPAMALAEHGTLAVDEYVGLHPDLFVAPNGHAYINNNPGVSVLAAIPLFLARPALSAAAAYGQRKLAASAGEVSAEYDDPRPNRQKFYRQVRERGLDIKFGVVSFVTVAFFMAPLTALAGVLFYGVLRALRLPQGRALLYAVLLVFGTPLFFRAGYLNHNHVLGLAVFLGFVLLWRPGAAVPTPGPPALAMAGALGGFAVFCDYSAAVPLVFLSAMRCCACGMPPQPAGPTTHRCWRGAAWFAAGAAVPLAALFAYQWTAFGSPWRPAQFLMPETTYSGRGVRGMSWPAADLFAANLFDLRFGLFAFCPLLLLGIPGSGWRRRRGCPARRRRCSRPRRLTFLLFCSANQFARMQWNTGVRYLLPMVPFLMLGVVVVLERVSVRARYALAAAAFAQSWAIAMVRESVPESLLERARSRTTAALVDGARKDGAAVPARPRRCAAGMAAAAGRRRLPVAALARGPAPARRGRPSVDGVTRMTLSVVIVIASDTLRRPGARRASAALPARTARTTRGPPLEVVVPHLAGVAGLQQLAGEFPAVRFLEVGDVSRRHSARARTAIITTSCGRGRLR